MIELIFLVISMAYVNKFAIYLLYKFKIVAALSRMEANITYVDVFNLRGYIHLWISINRFFYQYIKWKIYFKICLENLKLNRQIFSGIWAYL